MVDLPERERTIVVEAEKVYPTPAEKEGLVKRVEEPDLEKPVSYQGQVLVTSAAAQKPKIVLPLTRDDYLNPTNWHKPVIYAIRWLLTWVQRVIKMQPGRVIFENSKS